MRQLFLTIFILALLTACTVLVIDLVDTGKDVDNHWKQMSEVVR